MSPLRIVKDFSFVHEVAATLESIFFCFCKIPRTTEASDLCKQRVRAMPHCKRFNSMKRRSNSCTMRWRMLHEIVKLKEFIGNTWIELEVCSISRWLNFFFINFDGQWTRLMDSWKGKRTGRGRLRRISFDISCNWRLNWFWVRKWTRRDFRGGGENNLRRFPEGFSRLCW